VNAIFRLCKPFKKPTVISLLDLAPTPPWYPGTPRWEHDDLFVDKFRKQVGPAFDLLVEPVFDQRKADIAHRFYTFQYAGLHAYSLCEELGRPISFEELAGEEPPTRSTESSWVNFCLSYSQHMEIHVRAGCKVELLQQELCQQDPEELMTASEFKVKVNVTFPEVVVGKCDYCSMPAIGECICGEVHCSAVCQASNWTHHRELCNTVIDNCVFLLSMTPLGWGQKTISDEEYNSW
jgi:hypothetical protein